MNCSFCGKGFDEQLARKSCQACAMFGGCRKLKCPHCGYEVPPEPASLRWVRKLLSRIRRTDHDSPSR